MTSPDGKRRLPLAPKVDVAQPEDEDRPPWHWSAIGVVGIFVFWLPLAAIVNGVLGARTGAITVLLNALAFALASFGAGLLVGRYGAKAGRREAAVSGCAAALTASLVALPQSLQAGAGGVVTWLLLLAVLGAIGGGAAWAGGAIGVSRRR
jgi:tRNA-(ms[2]io[6]A)-hydroxylase